jgi:hypothetical protein
MPDKLQQAITAIKSGDKETGKQLLIEILKVDRRNEVAWLWMTKVVDSQDERIKCLQNVLKINPDNEAAKRGLAIFQQKQVKPAQQSDAPQEIKQQSSKRSSSTKTSVPPQKKTRPLLVILIIVLVVCCVLPITIPVANNLMRRVGLLPTFTPSPTPGPTTPTSTPMPIATSDMCFTITQNSLGSKKALVKEISGKGWKFKETETMSDGTLCDIYEASHVIFGLCAVEDQLKTIIIKGDEFADFNPVFAIASMYDIRYIGDFEDAVTDIWFDLSPGESTVLDLDTDGVVMTIQKTYNDGYGITYILESHIP